jgi:hypothetical protein
MSRPASASWRESVESGAPRTGLGTALPCDPGKGLGCAVFCPAAGSHGRGIVAQRQPELWSVLVSRKLLVLGLALALTIGVSCTSGDMPLESQIYADVPTDSAAPVPPDTTGAMPPDTAGAVPPDTTGAVPPDTTGAVPPDTAGTVPAGEEASLLSCQPQAYAVTTKVIGPRGGSIIVGDHSLKIFEDALSEDVTITAEQIEGTVNSVRFSPAGLHFAIPAVLSLSYKNCANVWHPKRIAYVDESLNILEWPLSLDFNRSSQVKGLIYHFSRYAVAF